ncbi:hypothetical protein GALL_358010 [mine drainage metagenome]|uniref:Uncharacterized protein n=1 Tax=mine drainage metagenome TaxID=410659 RepID=A0A1J5R2N3_9ZZZZ
MRLSAHRPQPAHPVEREGAEVPVRQLHTLGPSGRSGRVDDRCEVVPAGEAGAARDLGVVHGGPGGDEVGQGALVDHKDRAEARERSAGALDERRVRGGLDDRETDVGVREDPLDLVR